MRTDRNAPRRYWVTRPIFTVPALLLLALMAWALASPVGASPDDDFHLASIWCAQGDRGDECATAADPDKRTIPKEVVESAVCYAFHAEQSAACQPGNSTEGATDVVTTDRGNFAHLYPPLYYLTMSLFVSSDVAVSVVVMRLANVLLFVALNVFLAVLLPIRRRQNLIIAWIISSVPLGAFLLASNNPSAWAIISGGMLWIALVGYFESNTGWKKVGLGTISVVVAVMGAGARADSALYGVLAVAIAVILTMKRSRRYWLFALLPLGIAVLSVALYFSTGQSMVASQGLGQAGGGSGPGWRFLLYTNLIQIPNLWTGVFGSWGLGWLDTLLPGFVSVGCLVCFAVVAFSGLRYQSKRKLVALVLVGAALIAVPVYVLVQSNTVVGSEVQPRYILPLIVLLGGVALFGTDIGSLQLSRTQRYLVVGVLSMANALSLHTNLRRYVTGVDVTSWNLDANIEWWWNLPASPMVVWGVGSLAFALLLGVLLKHGSVSEHAVTPTALVGSKTNAASF